MKKIKFDMFEFYWDFKMSPEEFLDENIDYFSQLRLDKNPEKAYKINDWDLECVYDDIEMKDVAEVMTELYREYLQDNRNV